MRTVWFFSIIVGCLTLGCRSKESRATNDRVNVRAPGVNVRVGEEGGARVRAPFVNIETSQYRSSQGSVAAPPNAATDQGQNGVQYAPLNTTSNYLPLNPIPPAAPIQP